MDCAVMLDVYEAEMADQSLTYGGVAGADGSAIRPYQ